MIKLFEYKDFDLLLCSIIQYRGWLVKSSSWQQGTHNLYNPVNHQIRKVRDIFIFRYNDHPIYL